MKKNNTAGLFIGNRIYKVLSEKIQSNYYRWSPHYADFGTLRENCDLLIRGHSKTTRTRWGGTESNNVCFCPRSGYKTVQAGGGSKNWQNSVHAVVECPLTQTITHEKYIKGFLKAIIKTKLSTLGLCLLKSFMQWHCFTYCLTLSHLFLKLCFSVSVK